MSQDPAPPPLRITVTGGAGGQAANTADIVTSAALVVEAATHLDEAGRRCTALSAAIQMAYLQHLFDTSPARDPLRGIHLRSALEATGLLAAALATQISLLHSLDQSTRSAAQVLEDAEQSLIGGMWTTVRTIDGWNLNPLSALGTGLFGAMSVPGGTGRERFVAGLGAGIGKFNMGRSFLRPPQTEDGAALVRVGVAAYGALPWPSATGHLPGVRHGAVRDLRPGSLIEHDRSAPPVTSMDGAITQIKDLPAETVEVQRITQPDGTITWAVFIRGTDDWMVGSTSPFSGENNLIPVEGERSPGMQLVESAMEQAGIPLGAPVGMYGHSQGGTIAVTLAADPIFRRRYDLRSVATFGSPVAAIVPDQPVPILSVQNQDEVVSSLAGVAPPDSPERVTIDTDLPGTFGSGPSGHSAHSLVTHADVLDAALTQDLPGVAAAVQQQTAVLGDPGVAVLPAGGPDAGRQVVNPPADVLTMRFSPGPTPTPAPVCQPPPPPPVPGLTAPRPPTTADGSLDWAEMTRRHAAASATTGDR